MKNFVEKIKDFLYDATDYLLILVIIVGVVAVIGWRLDILFAKDMDKTDEAHDKPPIVNVTSDKKDNDTDSDKKDNDITDNNDNMDSNDKEDNINQDETRDNTDNENDQNTDNNDEDIDSKPDTDEIVIFKIPSGSFPPAIANILLEKGLIDNKMDFLIKSQELKLDTKLKSGEFKIKKGTDLEELIKILAK
ncbi:hypothetical protein DW1_1385 [Proteiniborus sp. DW1]|uniref:hypothetical protein n=1 Tax=Proteiniborus sp. DW1 TaxID=1889883 RepID=UPI00092DEE08|nr:hypothetical protein [Proteiniborus sp. DW1]SCG82956.1 hypothetical protein DW1_1385 [Proteiniborus sp. DW1]